jgi:phosphate transport system substrate-binding protein
MQCQNRVDPKPPLAKDRIINESFGGFMVRSCVNLVTAAAVLAFCGCGEKKIDVWDQIRAVGSTSAKQYADLVGEALLIEQPKLKPPIVEATGSGSGIKIFCSAVGGSTPDIAFSSRRMKKAEHDECTANGVKDTIEFQIAMDGIVLAQTKGGAPYRLSSIDMYRAVAAYPGGYSNRAETWSQINPALPPYPILIYGPGSVSGTRSGLVDLIMKPACKSDPRLQKTNDQNIIIRECEQFRDDGHYILTDENDTLMLYKLKANKQAIGIVPSNFFAKHSDMLQAVSIDGVTPSDVTIRDETYSGSRRIYVYVKREHLGAVPGLKAYVAKLQSESAPGGMLAKTGLIASSDAVRAESLQSVNGWKAMDVSALR